MCMAAGFSLLLTHPLIPTLVCFHSRSEEGNVNIEFSKPFSGISSNVSRAGAVICSMSQCWSQAGSEKHKDGDTGQQSKPDPIQFGQVSLIHPISLSVPVLSHPRVRLHFVDVCRFIVQH